MFCPALEYNRIFVKYKTNIVLMNTPVFKWFCYHPGIFMSIENRIDKLKIMVFHEEK